MSAKRRVFIDTNVLGYLLRGDAEKRRRTEQILSSERETPMISTQIIGEFVSIARKKASLAWSDIRFFVKSFRDTCHVETVTDDDQDKALEIAERYGISWWDSQIVAIALRLEAETLYSEDMQHGQRIARMRILNPFQSGPQR